MAKTATKKSVKEEIKDIKATAEAVKEATAKAPVSMARIMKRLSEISVQQKQLEEEEKALKEKLKSYMKDKKYTELLTNELKALYTVSYRTTFDKDGFQKDHPKYYKEYLKYCVKGTTPIESLKVSNLQPTRRKVKKG